MRHNIVIFIRYKGCPVALHRPARVRRWRERSGRRVFRVRDSEKNERRPLQHSVDRTGKMDGPRTRRQLQFSQRPSRARHMVSVVYYSYGVLLYSINIVE